MSDSLQLVAPFTPGTSYEEEARVLAASADAFGYAFRGLPIRDQGHWTLNIVAKPRAIRDAWRLHAGPTLVLDADCRIVSRLEGLLELLPQTDLAIKIRPHYCFTSWFNVGVMLLNRTPVVGELLDLWVERTEAYGRFHWFPDQATFSEAMVPVQDRLRVTMLPVEYHVEPKDEATVPEGERRILHHKESTSLGSVAARRPIDADTSASRFPAVCACLQPRSNRDRGGIPMDSVEGELRDFGEYVRRWNVQEIVNLTLATADDHPATRQLLKLEALERLSEGVPADCSVLVAEHDVLFQGDPRPFVDVLRNGELGLAWDTQSLGALPSTKVISFRNTAQWRGEFLPLVRERLMRFAAERQSGDLLARAMEAVLREQACRLDVAVLPEETVQEIEMARSETMGLIVPTVGRGASRRVTEPLPAPHFSAGERRSGIADDARGGTSHAE